MTKPLPKTPRLPGRTYLPGNIFFGTFAGRQGTNASVLLNVPVGVWELLLLTFHLTTDATVAARQPRLAINWAGSSVAQVVTESSLTGQAASIEKDWCFGAFGINAASTTSMFTAPLPNRGVIFKSPDAGLSLAFTNGQAGDVVEGVRYIMRRLSDLGSA